MSAAAAMLITLARPLADIDAHNAHLRFRGRSGHVIRSATVKDPERQRFYSSLQFSQAARRPKTAVLEQP